MCVGVVRVKLRMDSRFRGNDGVWAALIRAMVRSRVQAKAWTLQGLSDKGFEQ